MATPAQVTANRLNADHSTGPRTPDGKARASRNAVRHGLASSLTNMPEGVAADFKEILEDYTTEFSPNGQHETFLVEQLAFARLRMIRIQRLELRHIGRCFDVAATSEQNEADAAILRELHDRGADILATLHRYAAAAERSYYRAHRELLAIHIANAQMLKLERGKRIDEAFLAYTAPPPFTKFKSGSPNEPKSDPDAAPAVDASPKPQPKSAPRRSLRERILEKRPRTGMTRIERDMLRL